MLFDELREVDNIIYEYETKKQLTQKASKCKSILAEINSYYKKLNEFSGNVKIIQKLHNSPIWKDSIAKIIDEHIIFLQKLLEIYQEGNLIKQNVDFSSLKKDIEDKNRDCSFKWKEVINNELKNKLEILRVLASIFESPQIGEIIRKIEFMLEESYPTEDNYKRIAKLDFETNKIFEQVELEEKIIDFLNKVYSKTATLSDLNEETIKWCRKNKIDTKLKISF
jgi:hypothetical protein